MNFKKPSQAEQINFTYKAHLEIYFLAIKFRFFKSNQVIQKPDALIPAISQVIIIIFLTFLHNLINLTTQAIQNVTYTLIYHILNNQTEHNPKLPTPNEINFHTIKVQIRQLPITKNSNFTPN